VASLTLIIPIVRRDAFNDPAWLFDLKLDGFRGLADNDRRPDAVHCHCLQRLRRGSTTGLLRGFEVGSGGRTMAARLLAGRAPSRSFRQTEAVCHIAGQARTVAL
jgi:hypothetical protein